MGMKKRWLIIVAITIIVLGYSVYVSDNSHDAPDEFSQQDPHLQLPLSLEKPEGWIVAAGKVEPVSEAIDLSFELSGIIDTVLVKEGDTVSTGQILATLKAGEREARLEASKSALDAQRAVHEKFVTGARREEKSEAWAILQQAKADMNNAKVEAERRKKLLRQQLIAKEEVDRSTKDYEVAKNLFEGARQRYLITLTQSRKEDIRKAFSDLQSAQSKVEEMGYELEKATLRSPIDGTVLRQHRKSGERVSIFLPGPVLTIGNISQLNVRAEVLEKDIRHVKVGRLATIRTDAFPDKSFSGKVVRITPEMGEKSVFSEKPEELYDAKILEVIIALDSSKDLIPALQVDVFIPTENSLKSD